MKNKCLTFILIAIIGCIAVSCDNETTGGNPDLNSNEPQTAVYVSKDSGGNLYTLEITEKLQGRAAHYTAKQGDTFRLTVELFRNGTYTVALTYSGTINSAQNSGADIVINITVNSQPLTVTISGTEMTVITGDIVNESGQKVVDTPETLTVFIDKRALEAALTAANTAKAVVVVSANGADVPTTAYWVTQTQMTSFTTAIVTAQAFYDDEEADQSMVNSAKITLTAATTVFNGQKKAGTKTVVGGVIETGVTVYMAGSYGENPDGSNKKAWYRINNGTPANLSLPAGSPNAGIQAIAVSGTDIYAAGYYTNSSSKEIPCYWKNGVRTDLSIPEIAEDSNYVSAIAVAGTDVYTVGRYNWYEDEFGYHYTACYWKNGIRTDLSIPSNAYYAYAESIAVSGTDVYIAGGYSSDNYTACYWKNGVRTDMVIPQGFSNSLTSAITVVGTDVYVAGCYWDNPAATVNCYWKNNGTPVTLPLGANDGTGITAITVSGTDTYVLGYYWDSSTGSHDRILCYWKNAVKTNLPVPSEANMPSAEAIVVKGSNVYVAGSYLDSSYNPLPCYWKNGTINALDAVPTGVGMGYITYITVE